MRGMDVELVPSWPKLLDYIILGLGFSGRGQGLGQVVPWSGWHPKVPRWKGNASYQPLLI